MLRSTMFVAVTAGVLVLAGCQSGDDATTMPSASSASLGILNDTCPVMQEPVDPNAATASFHGYKIGFCCSGCKGQWEDMSESAKQQFVAKYTE